jgi:FdrA protein
MGCTAVRVRPDSYVDSIQLMEATRAMEHAPGVEWATALMGTAANLDALAAEGVERSELGDVAANDVVLAVRAASEKECKGALVAAEAALSRQGDSTLARAPQRRPRTLEAAAALLSGANLAVVSVPGPYAALEAHKALSNGMHVLLFSDNVPIEDEVELKARGAQLGLFVMGPGAGTAMLGGAGLGFANVVRRGGVGVAAAAGTGAQEVMSLLHRWGAGVSQVVGVGGRDLSQAVGGRMMRLALRALEEDPDTQVILVVSKPPAPDVARALVAETRRTKPAVAVLIGLQESIATPEGVTLASTMEEGVLAALAALGMPPPDLVGCSDLATEDRLAARGRAVCGLFSGGTLCYEAMTILSSRLGPVYSNTPLRQEWSLPAPAGSHICLDLGEEEYTRGRPHPMIDPAPRAELIVQEGQDPATGVLLIDVVLGYGAHPDPASILAPACAHITSRKEAPIVVAYILGTEGDPQGYERQCAQLREAGCIIAPTGAASARIAASLVGRDASPSPPAPPSDTEVRATGGAGRGGATPPHCPTSL